MDRDIARLEALKLAVELKPDKIQISGTIPGTRQPRECKEVLRDAIEFYKFIANGVETKS